MTTFNEMAYESAEIVKKMAKNGFHESAARIAGIWYREWNKKVSQ